MFTPPEGIADTGYWQDPPQCMPDVYKDSNAIHAYWNYYINDKKQIVTKDEIPYNTIPADIF